MQKRKLIVLLLLLLCRLLPAQEMAGPLVGGNSLWSTKSGEAFLARLLEDLGSAQNTIEVEYYWLSTDESGRKVRDALIEKAREGVQVKVLLDNFITPFAPESFYDAMRKAGAQVRYVHDLDKMGPFQAVGSIFGPRDHRKIVVIDGHIAYTGGINFCNHAILEWQDTQVRVQGPVAAQLQRLFSQSWQHFGGEAAEPSSPAPAGEAMAMAFGTSGGAQLDGFFVELLQKAQRSIYLQTPYFAPPRGLVDALMECAARGVDVRVLGPEASDWGFMNELTREYAVELMRAGVGVYVYEGTYDHTKIFVWDNKMACCSTVNLDYRSLRTNWEDGILFYDAESIRHFREAFLEQAGRSRPLGPDAQPAKGFRKLVRNILLKMSPLF